MFKEQTKCPGYHTFRNQTNPTPCEGLPTKRQEIGSVQTHTEVNEIPQWSFDLNHDEDCPHPEISGSAQFNVGDSQGGMMTSIDGFDPKTTMAEVENTLSFDFEQACSPDY